MIGKITRGAIALGLGAAMVFGGTSAAMAANSPHFKSKAACDAERRVWVQEGYRTSVCDWFAEPWGERKWFFTYSK